MDKAGYGLVDEETKKKIDEGVKEVLSYLHQKRIIHKREIIYNF